GFGSLLWLLPRLGKVPVFQPLLVTLGAKLWNLGVTVGILGILAGDSTGFENLELPRYAAMILFLGYLFIGVCAVLTFHRRSELSLYPTQWFLLAALFWFPWIFTSAYLLLTTFPVRGVAQAVIAWWYSNNLRWIWLDLVGIGALLYFLPLLG